MPHVLLSVGGAVVPLLRELRETEYQFAAPYVLDSSAIEAAYGLAPTPWDEVCRATALNAEPAQAATVESPLRTRSA